MLVEALVGAVLGLLAFVGLVVLILRRSPDVFVAERLAEALQRGPEGDVEEGDAIEDALGGREE